MIVFFSDIYFTRYFYFNFYGRPVVSKNKVKSAYCVTEKVLLVNSTVSDNLRSIVYPFFLKKSLSFKFFSNLANVNVFSSNFFFNRFSFVIPLSPFRDSFFDSAVLANQCSYDFSWFFSVRDFSAIDQFWFFSFYFFTFKYYIFFSRKFLFFTFKGPFIDNC